MKRVENISINGIVFRINDDAYHKLNKYLDALNQYFEQEEGGNEIITDIEARIAELFTERAGGVSQAITDNDVSHVIETLGKPEDIADPENEGDNSSYDCRRKYAKRLYRNPDQRILGGICAGIASYLGISALAVRLIFFACFWFYGISVLAYFLLWIMIPAAKTTAQKLEMQGQEINISNIEKSIKEGISSSGLRQSFDQFSSEAGDVTNKLFKIVFVCFRIMFGVSLFFSGIAVILMCFAVFLFQDIILMYETEWDILTFDELLRHMVSPSSYGILIVCATLIIVLTVAAFMYWGIKIITWTKVKYVKLHVALLILWLLIIPAGIITAVREACNYKWHNKTDETVAITTARDTIYLNMHAPELRLSNNFKIYYDKKNACFYGKPDIFFRTSTDGNASMEIVKSSQGRNKLAALEYAEKIGYEVVVRDSLIVFPPYFTVEPQGEWRCQQLDIFLYIPENTVIISDRSLCHSGILRIWSGHDAVCKWIMTKNGLQAINYMN
jgi:phage shock protein PspC (stress-responsive transcriptional regulator)